MHVVVEDGVTADFDGEDSGKLLKSVFDPLLAVFICVSTKEQSADASGDAVVVGCDSGIYELSSWPCHAY